MRTMYSSGARASRERKELKDALGSKPESETLVELLLTREKNWSAVNSFTTTVMNDSEKRSKSTEDEETNNNGSRIFPVTSSKERKI